VTGDKGIRWSTIAVVAAIALVAAVVSYRHALEVVNRYGETGLTGELLPGTVDGVVYCSSMVLLHAARHQCRVRPLARWGPGCGIAATLAANLAAGLGHGLPGAVIAAWPAAAQVFSHELLLWLVRASASQPDPLALTSEAAALAAYRTSVASGAAAISARAGARHGISRRQAGRVATG
jgi:Protein of unknown function (DUF2637)